MSTSPGEDAFKHTCTPSGRSSCSPCMQLETELWEAVNRYAFCVGGDPAKHAYGNVPRMQAVADVGKIVSKIGSWQKIYQNGVAHLVKSHDAAAATACDRGAEVNRLRASLLEARDFLTSLLERYEIGRDVQSLREDFRDEVKRLDHVLDATKEQR